VNVRVLIDGIVGQTTILIAQLSTAAGVRAPLAHVADQVLEFLRNAIPMHHGGGKVAIELAPGVVIAGRYQLERALGQGGMGVVWAAMHTVTRKRVALKFLRGPLHMRPELRRRFMREARAASAVVHPNVLEVHDVLELEDETPVMMMDLLEGETLGQRLTRKGRLSLSETADILLQVVSGVGTAHAVGVVHRDLKPDNVFLMDREPPSVRVIDFGIAKLVSAEGPAAETGAITGTGAMLGTPCYMSPEQSFGERDIDHRSDIWAIGVIFYECLTGARPVEGDSIGQVVKRLVTDGITPIAVILPDLPPEISDLVDRMLCREREGRPQDLREVSEILSRHTGVRAPEFGAATSEPAARPAEASGPAHGVPSRPEHAAHDRVHALVAPLMGESPDRFAQPVSGPETAGAHTRRAADLRVAAACAHRMGPPQRSHVSTVARNTCAKSHDHRFLGGGC
jgi:eukaryotic-like serine/threonine-protein kinase